MTNIIQEDRNLYKQLLKLALPIMGANLLQMLYNLADAYFLGKLGKDAVSAPSIAFTLVFFLVVFGTGFSMAGTTLISQSKGKKDQEKIDFYLGQMIFILIFTSILIMVLGLTFSKPLLRLLQVPESAFEYTYEYVTITFLGIPLSFMVIILQSSLQGIGNSVTPLYIQLCTVLLNVILDPLLIFGIGPFPAMEVKGAALATLFSQGVASIISFYILVKGKSGLKLRLRNLRPNKEAVTRIVEIGLPASLGQSLSAFGFTVLQGAVNSFGTAVVAAFGIGNRITNMFSVPAQAFAQATSSLVGQSLGAKNKKRAVLVVKQAALSLFVFITIGMGLTFFYGHSFVKFFINDPEVINHGVSFFRINSISTIIFSLYTVITGAFQGGGDTKPIMLLNIFRLWGLRVPLAYLLSSTAGWGPIGIWSAIFTSNLIVASLGFIHLKRGRWLVKIDPDKI
jgi:putative MATE family efflux protein